ncbi:MAG: peptidyl-prolyl cis-trans isomerase [Acidobacteriota bacterium]|jgi:peptidyl-prolyl cis-trans isomerase D|nr:peptidyl-prolyl cis-trans isomerase [Acidobacteriota bacterium]
MLKYLSKMERTRSLIIVGFAILMAVSLVVFYAPGRNSSSVSSAGTAVVASVGSDDITVADVTSSLTSQGGDPSMLNRQIAELLLKRLIHDRVVVQEARRLGLTASDAEVASVIREYNKDAEGKVDVQKYMDRVGDVSRYEERVRDSIASDKLRAFVTAGVTVSDEELQDRFRRQNTSFSLVYVPIVEDKLAAKINPSEQELKDFYEKHKTDYRILEPQKKVRYLFIDQNKIGEKIQVADVDLRKEYDKLTDDKKQAGVKAQQIVLRTSADPTLDATQKAKADSLAAKARGQSGTSTEEAFAEVAKGNSEDPASAKNGGAVAGIIRKSPSNPDDPYQQLLELSPGEIVGPIKYKNSYYILRRGDSVPKTFEDAKMELQVSSRNRKAYSVAAALAQRAAERLKATRDVQVVARELAADANMNPTDMVRETPYIVPGDDVPNIGSSQQFEAGIKPLENLNDIGEVTPIKNGFAIPMLVDKKDPNRIPEFEEVKDKVLQAFRKERAKAQVEETARNLANSAGSANELKAAAEKLGLEAKTVDDYKTGSPLGDLDAGAAAEEAISALKEGEVTKTPVKMGDNWVIVGATKRKEADLTEFAKQRDALSQTALAERRNQVFEDYILAAQNRMEAEGRIKIYDSVLAQLGGGEEPTINAPQRPQAPARQVPIQIPSK